MGMAANMLPVLLKSSGSFDESEGEYGATEF
jgi:hypothetical protein